MAQLARGAGGCRALKAMSLRGNYGGDEGATGLAESLRKGCLIRLDYSENGVGGDGAAEFGAWLQEVRQKKIARTVRVRDITIWFLPFN
jgi:hypothetical protein